eukprot:5119424-Pleurochrysis_carterae.AAC.3
MKIILFLRGARSRSYRTIHVFRRVSFKASPVHNLHAATNDRKLQVSSSQGSNGIPPKIYYATGVLFLPYMCVFVESGSLPACVPGGRCRGRACISSRAALDM